MAVFGSTVTLTDLDRITVEEKVTSAYFSNDNVSLLAGSLTTSSLSDTNETYFFGISHTSTLTTQEFNVAFGSTNGYGSDDDGNDIKAPTDAIYKQYASLLLAPTEVTGGFYISSPGSNSAVSSGPDTEIFILSARRSNMKDRINKGTWQINLSGSNSAGNSGTGHLLHLKDDSSTTDATATPCGDRYNIVSCSSAGVIAGAATVKNFGFFYPDMGIMVFSAAELSASIPGASGSEVTDTVVFDNTDHKGFAWSTDTNANEKTALRFINCLQPDGCKMTFRKEEDEISKQFFCRIRAGEYNFSNNPTFVSGSNNELRNKSMWNFPVVYITGIQLYNAAGDVVAVGKLSTPLKKNFSSEATIKVKLTY